jgi:hypothetical protein
MPIITPMGQLRRVTVKTGSLRESLRSLEATRARLFPVAALQQWRVDSARRYVRPLPVARGAVRR